VNINKKPNFSPFKISNKHVTITRKKICPLDVDCRALKTKPVLPQKPAGRYLEVVRFYQMRQIHILILTTGGETSIAAEKKYYKFSRPHI